MLVACGLGALTPTAFAAGPSWKPFSPADCADTTGQVEADAPAEVVFWEIEQDDHEYPERRRMTEYIRYKVYDPERVAETLRRSFVDRFDHYVEADARLILPDGTVTEFGKKDALVREATKTRFSNPDTKERYFAIPGVVRGAMVEFRIAYDTWVPSTADVETHELQLDDIPVRNVELVFRYPTGRYAIDVFAYNAPGVAIDTDRKNATITVRASNLKSILRETMVGPRSDYVATIMAIVSRSPIKFLLPDGVPGIKPDKNAGPWTQLAGIAWQIQNGWSHSNPRVRDLAARVCEGAATDLEKATRIHNHIVERYLRFKRLPITRYEGMARTGYSYMEDLDDVLEVENRVSKFIVDSDFVWLALALYREAGLEARMVLLPDRQMPRFNPANVSPFFLQWSAIMVCIGDEWRFSCPVGHSRFSWEDYLIVSVGIPACDLLPFGELPWKTEGQVGLVAERDQKELLSIPPAPAEQSQTVNMGAFKLDEAGDLSGRARRRLTGHCAQDVRGILLAKTEEERREYARDQIKPDFAAAEIEVESVTGVESVDTPIEYTFSVTWPGYAVVTKKRIVLKPEVFRASAPGLFTATGRRHPVSFPYRSLTVDTMGLQIPPGYVPEALASPEPLTGSVLNHAVKIEFDPRKRVIRVRRDFRRDLLEVVPEQYPMLKQWYDAMAQSDAHTLVFVREGETTTEPKETPNP